MARRCPRSASVDLDALWRSDLSAFARRLGVVLSPQTLRSIRTVEGQEWRAALDLQNPKHVKYDEEARWRFAEEMLWWAADGEKEERREADVRSGKIRVVRAATGMGWKTNATANVRASVGLPWRRRVCDLLEHPAVRAGIDAELFPILRDLVKAALADQAEAYKLRDQPDDAPLDARQTRQKAVNARWARDEAVEPPEGMAGIVERLGSFIAAAETLGHSKAQSRRKKGKGSKDVPGGQSPTVAEQDDQMRRLLKRFPSQRARAVKAFQNWGPGYTDRHARRVAARVAGPAHKRSTKNS